MASPPHTANTFHIFFKHNLTTVNIDWKTGMVGISTPLSFVWPPLDIFLFNYVKGRMYSEHIKDFQHRHGSWSVHNTLLYLTLRYLPNQKNIYGAALALIAIMYGIMQGIIAVASLLATMAIYGNGRDLQWYMSGIHNMCYSYHCSLIGRSTIYL